MNLELAITVEGLAATDSELVGAAQAGRREAREELARRYRRPAYLLALQLTGNREDAMDVAQDSLLRFFAALGRLRSDRPILPWLFRIVRNRAADIHRRRRVRRTESLEALLQRRSSSLTSLEPDPAARAQAAELQRRVWAALQRLSESHREILILREYQDLSYAEIAAVLGIPAGTVMSRLHAARCRMRDLLEEGCETYRENRPPTGGRND